MYKGESFLICKEELLRANSCLIGEPADLSRSISLRLSNTNSKTIKEHYELDVDNHANNIIKTTFKNNGMSRFLTKKIKNFLGLSFEIKEIECIVNVKYRESTAKSSCLTTLTKELLFLKDTTEEKKEKVCKCRQDSSPFTILALSI